MSFQSENERNKAVVDAFYQLGIQGRLTDFAQYLDPNFTWTAPNYLPWGATHTGAARFRDQVLSSLSDVFDFARFSYIRFMPRTAVSTRSSTRVSRAQMR
jgi:ketosteroid isomerase-like protein